MEKDNMFTPIDQSTWPTAQEFYYYTQMAPTSYSVTVKMDVTIMRTELKKRGYKFFPAYLYLVTRAINQQDELRVGVLDGVLGHWNTLTPAYPQFHEDDQTTSLLWTEYQESFPTFYRNYCEDTKRFGDSHGILSAKGIPLPNSYVISCIPWFTFESFCLHNHGIKDYYLPSFEAGKFVETLGKENQKKIEMPLSVTVHHATCDGYHLKVFFEELQETMNHPEFWIVN